MPENKKDKLERIALYEQDKKLLTGLTKKANLTIAQFLKDNMDDLIAEAEKSIKEEKAQCQKE